MRNEILEFLEKNIHILVCPKCTTGELQSRKDGLDCQNCDQHYQVSDSIPLLFWPNDWQDSKEDVTKKIKHFYEENPFPDYDDFDNTAALIEKARKGFFARLLDEQIPYGTRVLECGCGTGQLTNFLSIANRVTIGTDIALNPLKMAQEFKLNNGLDRALFMQMNLFRPCFKPNSFDLVIANGVLHHTSDPFLGFKMISSLAKPQGYVLIGLYHKYGRIFTDVRRFIFRITRNKLRLLDRRASNQDLSVAKREAWFMDQYKNPHESKHTIGEVLQWIDDAGLQFVKKYTQKHALFGF